MRPSSNYVLTTSLVFLGGCSALIDTSGLRADDPVVAPDGDGGTNASPLPDGGTTVTDGGTGNDAGETSDASDSGDGDAGTIPVIAQDAFGRSVAGGLGAADVGGVWQLLGTEAAFSVTGGTGHIALPSSTARSARLPVSSDDTDLAIAIATDKVPSGATAYLSILGRAIDATNDYRCRALIDSNGSVRPSLSRVESSTETKLLDTAALFNVSAGDVMRVRCQVIGTSPARLRMKLWKSTDTEPTTWIVETTDTTSSLQTKGGVGVYVYVDAITNGPLDITLDELLVRPASLLP